MRKMAMAGLGLGLMMGLVAWTAGGGKDEARGRYFPKKVYTEGPLPSFAASKDLLPAPVLVGNPELVELYWFCWRLAFDHLKQPTPQNGFVSNYLDEAFNPNIFQWDTIFMVMFARYGHHVFPAIESLDNFYASQHDSGFICREIWETDGTDHHGERSREAVNPPLFSWAEMESFRLTGDKTRLEAVAPALEKYTEWLETARKKPTVHGLYWNNGLGSGMDNTPRRGSGWVDMSSQMVMQYNDLAAIHEVLGHADQAARFRARAAEIGALINQWMWNEQDGLYYDVDNQGQQVKWKTAGCFWPLLAGITSPHQEEKLIANLRDPNSFWRENVFPTLAADQRKYDPTGGYWHGGVWAPTNYAIIRGLSLRGHDDFAREAALRYLGEVYEVYRTTGTVWELYAPDRPAPGTNPGGVGQARPDFVGWTGCGPIAMLIENVIGLRADALHRRLTWRLDRADRFGIERFRFGDVTVSLVCAARASAAAPAHLTVTADRPFDLIVVNHGVEQTFSVTPGSRQLELD
jgi:glycogen debranching enzyme